MANNELQHLNHWRQSLRDRGTVTDPKYLNLGIFAEMTSMLEEHVYKL